MSNRVGTVDFNSYIANVVSPTLRASTDDGALAVFLNRQLDEWELEAERQDGVPFAPRVVDCLTNLLVDLRGQIKAKIAAAEAVLVG